MKPKNKETNQTHKFMSLNRLMVREWSKWVKVGKRYKLPVIK